MIKPSGGSARSGASRDDGLQSALSWGRILTLTAEFGPSLSHLGRKGLCLPVRASFFLTTHSSCCLVAFVRHRPVPLNHLSSARTQRLGPIRRLS